MATVGNTSTPTHGLNWSGINTYNQAAYQITMPAGGGTITALSVYVGGHGGSATLTLCLWSATGALLAKTAAQSVGAGSGAPGGQSFVTASLLSSYAASSGQVLYVGFYSNPSQAREWSVGTTGGFVANTNTGGSPGSLTNPPSFPGGSGFLNDQMGAYATYTPTPSASLTLRRSGAWAAPSAVKVRRAGVWSAAIHVNVRRAGAWTQLI